MGISKRRFFKSYEVLANQYINDKSMATKLLKRTLEKISSRRVPVFKALKNIQLLIQLFGDWLNGTYKEIPRSTLVAIAAGLLYFVSPVDIIVDIIPFGGLIDDAAVIAFVLKQSDKDIKKYLKWKINN
jgi:uncharacterized membrane protein YkvA (DUF1232 family)